MNHRKGPLLRIEHVSKAFDGIQALNDVSFSVGAGELVALIGPNGAGKTTCFNVISGQLEPDAGVADPAGKAPISRHDALCDPRLYRTL